MPGRSIPHDFHLHTAFSIDCEMPMSTLCEQAIALGIPEICTTEHLDPIEEDEARPRYFQPEDYFAEVARCRERYGDRVRLRTGIEVGESHRFAEEAREVTSRYPFDFVIGSLHYVGPELVLDHAYFAGKSAEEAYGAYFEEMLRMVRTGDFDVVGHLDVVKRYGFDVLGPYDPAAHGEVIREVLRVCVERGIGIEINHGSLRRPVGEPSPGLEVLRWYRELGGEILTLGSDGHRPSAVGDRLDLAAEMARAAGFTHLTSFVAREPRFVPLD